MKYVVVGLGNPGEEYNNTRHNVGRMVLEKLKAQSSKPEARDWVLDKKYQSLVAEIKLGKNQVMLLKPETMMNNSGKALPKLITSKKAAKNLIVVHDDLDLPLGTVRVSFNRGSGGHRGIESIIRAIKTTEFTRVRVGISPSTPKGKTKKPVGEEGVNKFILGNFSPKDQLVLKKSLKRAAEAIELIITSTPQLAMNEVNQG